MQENLIPSTALDDPDTMYQMRMHNELFNEKTVVIEQLQKHLCSIGSRLGYELVYSTNKHDSVNKHKYVLNCSEKKPKLEVSFCAHSPLHKTINAVKNPQSIGQFNRFLEKLGNQLPAPDNGVITDMLRIMTVCNECTFNIDACNDDSESVLILEGPRLRQRIEFVVYH